MKNLCSKHIDENTFRSDVQNSLNRFATKIKFSSAGHLQGEVDPRLAYKHLGKDNLLCPHFPIQYGGLGLKLRYMAILLEELVDRGISENLYILSLFYAAETILMSEDENLKNSLLRKMSTGQVYTNILYSEVHAGSDLSKISTYLDGNRLVGQKIYSMKAAQSDYAIVAVRTTHSKFELEGITIILVPYSNKDIEIQIVESLSFEPFNQVTFKNALINEPIHKIGNLNQGWSILSKALPLERSGLDYYLKARRWIKLIENSSGTKCIKLMKLKSILNEVRFFVFGLLDDFNNDSFSQDRTAASKLRAAELAKEIVLYGLNTLDPLVDRAHYPEFEAAFREAPGLSLSGGSNEVLYETISRSRFFKDE